MPAKTLAERKAVLPAGLAPLLTQEELEARYGVSNWTVNKWIQAGMPVEPVKSPSGASDRRPRRFDLQKVEAWMASDAPEPAA